jgi:F-type H+-transporting ATPase subunit alpha
MKSSNLHFNRLVEAGNPVGEVIAVDRFMVKVRGLQPCQVHSIVQFEDGSKGYVHQVRADCVLVLHLGTENLDSGMIAVLQHQELMVKVGKNFIGRVVNVMGEPLDGKGPVVSDTTWPVFNEAVPLYLHKLLDSQVESGVTSVDALLPIVHGQRMSLMGDSKSGKSTLASQIAINQKNSDQIVVYCLIAKRRSDIDTLLSRFKENDAMGNLIVVVSTMFESLVLSYLAPYVACSMAEYLWQKCNRDVIIIYDDLTSHAHAHREISLLSGVSPGRDSYPGDMFYAHSSLLERAGKLDQTGKSLTAIPIVHTPGSDITAYLPTNVMSITDGQWVLDMDIFRSGVRPAFNFGLSVTRAGGTGHSDRQKDQAFKTLKTLADYRQAREFAHFGTEIGDEYRRALSTGRLINQIITQAPGMSYTLIAQQLMLDIIINLDDKEKIDVDKLKLKVNEFAKKVTSDELFNQVRDELKAQCLTTGNRPRPTNANARPTEPDLNLSTISENQQPEKAEH